MQLTQYTDFSLRLLIFLTLQEDNTLVTIDDVARHFNILKNHLTKIVHQLSKNGYVKTVRGKNGGICLAKTPEQINLSDIVKEMENTIEVVNCQKPSCPLHGNCELKAILNEAQDAFYAKLTQYTLADISSKPKKLKNLLSWT